MSDNSTNTIKLSALLEDAKAGGKVILDKAVTKENIGSGILLLLVTVLALKLLAWVERRRQRRGKPTPYPPRHWLLGNVPQVAAVVNQVLLARMMGAHLQCRGAISSKPFCPCSQNHDDSPRLLFPLHRATTSTSLFLS